LRISSTAIPLLASSEPGFLDPESRGDLIDLGRDGSIAHRRTLGANALVLLDDGMSCGDVARVLLLDGDTVRSCCRLYEEEGIEGLASFGYDGSALCGIMRPPAYTQMLTIRICVRTPRRGIS
jgi:hypothetical protein